MELKLLYHSKFLKHFRERISPNRLLVQEYKEALQTFLEDPRDPVLKDHQLTEAHSNKRAFWITGDIRVVYRMTKDGIMLYDIGSHPEVY